MTSSTGTLQHRSRSRPLESRVLENGYARFGGRPNGKGPAPTGLPPRRSADPTQTQKKWLAAQKPANTLAALQRQLNRFTDYYNNTRPHRALARHTPTQAYTARPKAFPTGPKIPPHYRVRHDKIDKDGSVTLRHNSRLHHIGLGTRRASTPITLLVDDLHIRVIHRHTGKLIRELTLNPNRDYQPRRLPPGPPKRT